jgi:hypothetical protein
MDSFYEESAVNQKAKKQQTIFTILRIVQIICIILAVIFGFLMSMTLQFSAPGQDAPKEQIEAYQALQPVGLFSLFWMISFILFAVLLIFVKRKFNLSYDYIFVSGELRVAKVLNGMKRKLVCIFDRENILQVGDVDSVSYDRLRGTPGLKEVVCTPNVTPADGKFFLYILAQVDGIKKLYVLECREELLINMMQFLRRDILDRDYIPQAKKPTNV